MKGLARFRLNRGGWSACRSVGWALLAGSLAGFGPGEAGASPFDQPLRTMVLPLPSDPQNPQAKAELSCFYFPRFMVKEVDLGEKGADQLSILPVDANGAPPCRRDNASNERVISDWNGYYKGVIGDYVFFDADDGWNDGMGFGVYVWPQTKKILDDTAKDWHSITSAASGLVLRYARVYEAPCSLEGDKATCWAKIRQETGLEGDTPPDCLRAYQLEQARTPSLATEVLDDPTILDYEVAVIISGDKAAAKPVTGKALGCRPAE